MNIELSQSEHSVPLSANQNTADLPQLIRTHCTVFSQSVHRILLSVKSEHSILHSANQNTPL